MLAAKGLYKFYSSVPAVQDVSFTLEPGQVLGYLGPNGSGKSTTVKMLTGLLEPNQGQVLHDGRDIHKNLIEFRKRLGYVPEEPNLYPYLSGGEYLDMVATLRAIPEPRKKTRIDSLMELFSLAPHQHVTIGSYSKGMRQRIGLAQALINDPELVIVDEPTAGLDPEERVRFRNVLSEIGFGKLVILSTHIVSDVESIATEIALMKNGSLLTMATPETLLRKCDGHVWQSVVASEQFDQLRTTLKISSAVRKPDGVHIRFVGPAAAIAAEQAEPELEDAFLYLMNFGNAALPPR